MLVKKIQSYKVIREKEIKFTHHLMNIYLIFIVEWLESNKAQSGRKDYE